ncbi:protein distal antenna-related-like [Eurosta solidaginis]|uniref:protein distal antenna-related-like n=1 Tax=Eurosta solidaginis TaxID=178769 RepID=UPI003530F1AF
MSAYQHLKICKSSQGKRQPRNLTPNDKVRAIQRIQNGETKASVSRAIGVPESTLRGWCKNEKKLRFMCNQIGTYKNVSNSKAYSQPAQKKRNFDVYPSTNSLPGIDTPKGITDYATPPLNCFLNNNNNYITLQNKTVLTEFMKWGVNPLHQGNTQKINTTGGKHAPFQLSPNSFRQVEKSIYLSTNWNQSVFVQSYLNQWLLFYTGFMPLLNENLSSTANQAESFTSYWKEVGSTLSIFQESLLHLEDFLYLLPTNMDAGGNQSSPIFECEEGRIGLNCGIAENDLTKEMEYVRSVARLNEAVSNIKKNQNIYGTCKTITHQWCKNFNGHLNYLTLAATLATMESSAIFWHDVIRNVINYMKNEREILTPDFGNLIQNSFGNSYIDLPEDLSMRSTITKICATQNCNLQSSIKSVDSGVR